MTEKIQILKELKKHLQIYSGLGIKDIILFGSQLMTQENSDSDFDLLIILDKDYNWKDENRILDLCYDIDLKYNILIDAHIISEKEINSKRGRQSIFINAVKSGVYA